MGKKNVRKILAGFLAVAVAATTIMNAPMVAHAAKTAKVATTSTTKTEKTKNTKAKTTKEKTITVATQKELDAALKKGFSGNIIIKTDAKLNITIKSGSFKKVSLTVDAPNVSVVNKGTFSNIQVKNANVVTEQAKGNTYQISDKKLSLTISKKAKVSAVEVTAKNADVNLSVNGKLSKVEINAKSSVKIEGETTSKVKIEVNAKNAEVSTAVKTDVTLNQSANVTLEKGAKNSTVKVTDEKVKYEVSNNTGKDVKVKDADGKNHIVENGSTVDEKEVANESKNDKKDESNKKDENDKTDSDERVEDKNDKEEQMPENKPQQPAEDPKPQTPAKDLSYAGYSLKWSDEFEGDSLNRADWNVELHDPGWVNSELQAYVDAEANIKVKDGNLYLIPVKTDNGDGTYSYTSGRINTQNKHDYTYGLFEVRAKVPAGMGYLPAFWMMPTDENLYGQWPRCGEIDCMEVMGQQNNKLYGTIHYGNPHSESQGTYILSNSNFTDEYHVFSCEWEPGKITWYVDGIKYHEESDWYSTTVGQGTVSYPAPFDQPFYMILNLAVGGSWVGYPDATTNFDNQAFVIDYVKAYQKDSYNENVTKPVKDVVLRNPDANGNYINNGDFSVAESLNDDTNWKFMTALEGLATATIAGNEMVVATENEGTVDYSVQLVQAGIPCEKGATYEVSFYAKADEARSTNVAIKAPDHGYQTYMTQNINLTTEYEKYTISYKMASDSDANGRLEYNMGATGSTATIYIKDVVIKKTAEANPDEVEEKVALSDGNYVYNGSFQEGDGRLGYWNVAGNMNVSVTALSDGRRLVADVTSAGAKISQDALAILEGKTYALSFDAQADAAKSLTVTVAGVEKVIEIAAGNANYSAKITIPASVDNKDFSISFHDAGRYYIDNVRLEEDALIKNGSFDAGTSGFDIYLYNTADASYVVDSLSESNALDLTIKNTNDADWKIQVKQNGVTLEQNAYYHLSFDIKSSIARSFTYAIQRDGSAHKTADNQEDWTPYAQETVSLEAYGEEGTYTHVDKFFQMTYDTDNGSIFNIALGGGNNSTQHRVCIDNISLVQIEEADMPVEETPEQSEGINLLKNGDFSKGSDGWSGEAQQKATASWSFDGTAKVVIESLGDAAISGGDSWHVNLKQTGLTLVKGCEYEVKATILSDVDRTAEFSSMDSTSAKWYVMGDNKFSLKANEAKTVTFKIGVGDNATDKSAYIGFNLGRMNESTPDVGTITIDDVSMVLVSGDDSASEDDSEAELALGDELVGKTFESSTEGAWDNCGCGDLSIDNGALKVQVIAANGTDDWTSQIAVWFGNDIAAGTYHVSFKIKSSKEHGFSFHVENNNTGDKAASVYDFPGITTEWQTMEKDIEITETVSAARLNFFVGKAESGDFIWIDDVSVKKYQQ